jgi:hypothetical protein
VIERILDGIIRMLTVLRPGHAGGVRLGPLAEGRVRLRPALRVWARLGSTVTLSGTVRLGRWAVPARIASDSDSRDQVGRHTVRARASLIDSVTVYPYLNLPIFP